MLNSGRRPAACQVEPAVSSARSSSTASVQPLSAKWYSVLTPTAPPPITTTRLCVFTCLISKRKYVRQCNQQKIGQHANCDSPLWKCDRTTVVAYFSYRYDGSLRSSAWIPRLCCASANTRF